MLKRQRFSSAQTILEYLLLVALVAFLTLVAFRQNGLVDITRNATKSYFDTGTRAIMGGYYKNGVPTYENPTPIPGGWCEWTACINGIKTRNCACHRPAFGGQECVGDAVSTCTGGPQTQLCPPGMGLISVPGQGCVCPKGQTWLEDKINKKLGKCVVDPKATCVRDQSKCSAGTPTKCGQTLFGVDNCGNTCTKVGPTADCNEKECGDDGCGGTCGTQPCPSGTACGGDGKCSVCVASCSGKVCGDDGCGGSCGPPCGVGKKCDASGQCVACTANCTSTGRNCGDDGCGGSCGTCGSGTSCSAAGQCETCGTCEGKGCGESNGCPGQTCQGNCPKDKDGNAQQCVYKDNAYSCA